MSTQQPPQFQPCNCAAGACTGACKPEQGGGGAGLVAAPALAPGEATAPLWAEASRIALLEPVSNALQIFSEDATLDNGIGVVAEVLQALLAELLVGPDGRNAALVTIADLKRVKALADATIEWSSERGPRDYGDAELLKAVWTYTGPYTGPCDGCDGECGEPCAESTTVEAAHAAIDKALMRRQTKDAETRRVTAGRIQAMAARRNAIVMEWSNACSTLLKAAWALEEAMLAAAAPFPAGRTLTDVIKGHPAVQVPTAALLPLLDALTPEPVATARHMPPVSDAALDVLAERQRQIKREHYTPEHDDDHTEGELGLAAALYALPYEAKLLTDAEIAPLQGALELAARWKLKPEPDRRKRLVKSAALALAEIERMDRAPAPQQPATGGTAA